MNTIFFMPSRNMNVLILRFKYIKIYQALNEQIICTGCIILLLRKSTLRCNKSLQLYELRGNVLQM